MRPRDPPRRVWRVGPGSGSRSICSMAPPSLLRTQSLGTLSSLVLDGQQNRPRQSMWLTDHGTSSLGLPVRQKSPPGQLRVMPGKSHTEHNTSGSHLGTEVVSGLSARAGSARSVQLNMGLEWLSAQGRSVGGRGSLLPKSGGLGVSAVAQGLDPVSDVAWTGLGCSRPANSWRRAAEATPRLQPRSARRTRSGVMGMWRMRTPVARAMALAMAAAGGTIGTSPTPRTP